MQQRSSSGSVKVISFDPERARRLVEQAVAELARRRPEIDRVILFGSLAAGGAVPGSDADLVVVLARSDRTFRSSPRTTRSASRRSWTSTPAPTTWST